MYFKSFESNPPRALSISELLAYGVPARTLGDLIEEWSDQVPDGEECTSSRPRRAAAHSPKTRKEEPK